MAVPGLESYIVVTVDEVDLANRLVHVKDKTGSKFQAFFRDHPGGWFYVPNQGEKWTAKKIGNFWHLEHMLDSLDDHTWAAANLQPGDLVIRAGKTWIMGAVSADGLFEAATAAVDTNTTQIATTAFVLRQAASATPSVDSDGGAVGASTRYARGDHVHPKPTLPNTQVFNPGAGQLWTKPAGATVVSIVIMGAGGGGGGGSVGTNVSGGAGGGSSAGVFIPNILASAFGSSVSIDVGAGGGGGAGSVGAGDGTGGSAGSRATAFGSYISISAGGGGQGGRTLFSSTGGTLGAVSPALTSTLILDFITAVGIMGGGGNRGSSGSQGTSNGSGGGGISVGGVAQAGLGAATMNFAPQQSTATGGTPGGDGANGYSALSSGAAAGAFSAPYRGQGGSGAAGSTAGTTGGKGGNGGKYGAGGGGGGSSDSGTGGAGGNGSDGIVVVISW